MQSIVVEPGSHVVRVLGSLYDREILYGICARCGHLENLIKRWTWEESPWCEACADEIDWQHRNPDHDREHEKM